MQLIKKENINKTGLLPTVETRGLSRSYTNKICVLNKNILILHYERCS